jgi:hypothetical protein
MTCVCCAKTLVRATDIPEARWLRPGDLYCRACELIVWREELVDGWPADRARCEKHRTRTTEGVT